MRILVLQLARFGDLYCSWPALRALKRHRPEVEIDLIVRERFADAAVGLNVGNVIPLPTAQLMSLCTEETLSPREWTQPLVDWVSEKRKVDYDRVYNFTYSPFSSYLANMVAGSCESIFGYHRYADGHLALRDDLSAYFYAQVGIGRPNREHLIRLYASLLEVTLEEVDFCPLRNSSLDEGIVVHLGASQDIKRWPADRWIEALTQVRNQSQAPITLIGSKDEEDLAFWVTEKVRGVSNLIGKTKMPDLFEIIGKATLLVGGDSAPIHVATLTGAPAVNLSFAAVNFWETGPLTPGSRVLWAENPNQLAPRPVADEILALLKDEPPKWARYYVTKDRRYLDLIQDGEGEDQLLLRCLYSGGPTPPKISPLLSQVVEQLNEVNNVALAAIEGIRKNPDDQTSQGLLARSDEIITALGQYGVSAGILVRWFQAERIRIPPGPLTFVLDQTFKVYDRFSKILTELMSGNKKGSFYGKAELEPLGFKE